MCSRIGPFLLTDFLFLPDEIILNDRFLPVYPEHLFTNHSKAISNQLPKVQVKELLIINTYRLIAGFRIITRGTRALAGQSI